MNVETNDHQDVQKTTLTPVEDRNILRRTAAWLDLLVKALAVFVPILYAIGRAYAHGYYEALGSVDN